MSSSYLVALATFFATVGVADIAFIFAALTKDNTPPERRALATRGVLIASGILFFFGFLGNQILDLFGVTIAALRTGGGILLMLIAIDMVFARHSGGTSTTSEEHAESRKRDDISVFPLAMPLMAGPGAISAVILLTTSAKTDTEFWLVLAALATIMFAAWLTLLVAIPVQRLLGLTGLSVVSRVIGILLAALSVQFIFDGIKASGLLTGG
ncbi:MarC family protein [Mariluticola halotolerans]|uniref:MarC family protein n=1 Tax=Mariluticola halotolerans TaxID=2909283 RepID=UPI0026E22E2B|nr:MarC family protein [Mariluticola halotolerans]UJQ93497.1 MarC family protein [Mariluticola halotolerans]